MKKPLILISTILVNILPIYSFSESDNPGVDMTVYSTIAGYGIFVAVAIFFIIFFYYLSHEEPYEVKFEKPDTAAAGNLSSDALAVVNIIYYLILALIVLYMLSIILTIF